jgi:adenosylhomocysteine nucleosidase
MQIEIDGIKEKIENPETVTVSGVDYVCGMMGEKKIIAAKCGVGKVFAALCAQTMILRFAPDCIINTGVAGGLAEGLVVGDVVLADYVVQHDMDTSALGDPVGLISGLNIVKIPADKALLDTLTAAAKASELNTTVGTVASGDLFVADPADKARIVAQFDAAACEMEGAAIGQVAYTNGIPFAVLRAISDGGDGMEFSQFVGLAATRSVKVTREFVKRLHQ